MTTLRLIKSNYRSLLRNGCFLLLLTFVFAWLALAPTARAVSPPPDGGYPNFTTAEGDHALQALTLGLGNTGSTPGDSKAFQPHRCGLISITVIEPI